MTYKAREEEFLKELSLLTHKYRISIGGCGCCGSPFLTELGETIEVYFPKEEPHFRNYKVTEVSYHYKDDLDFSKTD